MKPLKVRPRALILTPGASADRDDATLVAIDETLADIEVVRLTLATTSVNSAVKKIVAAAQELSDRTGIASSEIALGGRSFGGRSCSVAVAQGFDAAALCLLSYPLHPPGKPEKLRVDHFDSIKVPTLFISGERDPFGSPEEFGEHLPKIPGPTEFLTVPGNHSPKAQIPQICSLVSDFLGSAG